MAFENPFLTPSVTRQEALRYLWADEPTGDSFQGSSSASIVDNVFDLSKSTDKATNIIGNIANNGGEYNPDDTTNYKDWAEKDPVAAFKTLQENKGLIKGTLSLLGVPFAGSIVAGIEQNEANNILGRVQAFVGQYGGQTTEKGSVIGEAIKAALPFGVGSSDSIEAAKGLVNAFGTAGAMDGYFTAALDPTIGQIVSGMIADPTTITPAQYGTIGQAVSERINNNIVSGMNLNESQNEAISFFNPPTAISTPVAPPGSVEVTDLSSIAASPDPFSGSDYGWDSSGGMLSSKDVSTTPEVISTPVESYGSVSVEPSAPISVATDPFSGSDYGWDSGGGWGVSESTSSSNNDSADSSGGFGGGYGSDGGYW